MSDSTELAHIDQAGRNISSSDALNNTAQMLSMIRELALDPNVDADKFKTIAEVAERQQDRMERKQFYNAKANALLEMPVIDKRGKIMILDKNNPSDLSRARTQGTFAKWPDLQRTIVPILAKYDLILTHDIGHSEAMTTVTPILQHRNGFVERGEAMKLPLDTSGGKNNTQGAGSAASYGKRHTSIGMLGIRLEDSDDDGALMALEDEPLTDTQARLVQVAEARVLDGIDAYNEWFKKIEPRDRAWLIQTKRHDTYLTTGSPASIDAPKQEDGPGDPPPDDETSAKIETATVEPEGVTPLSWTEKYESDCKGAVSREALERIQLRAARALEKLEKKHPDLHQRAIMAETDAIKRLAGGGDMFGGSGD